ncbi:MAG: hypothetical protein A2070_09810 [Bdellovibrionales bacterium GWC1_52_8]|nr:MAG: hypothetical protein A2Z97_07745 [Bdellovibrionales bacterium GWB1_52_6]OFZ04818.1 MAG: hypothetical protein A2X97_13685 [Bdellovibrionales bacterium GWA1_52_35]OFZ43404.1 MAG: hypothetical protein A2070_09810 [Bdellovibrionales bacterium GWC1_52_8]
MLTPFNIITAPIILVGGVLIVIRFWKGIGYVSNLSQEFPWGIWIGFDVVTGVAFAAGAYVLTFVVDILKFKKYEPVLRATVLNGLLAYVFYSGALLIDIGRPWNIVNPIIGNKFGFSSVMFLVAWHFLLYMICEFLEFAPAIAEWLGWWKLRKFLHAITAGAVILGITLSTLHQAGLGSLFLLARNKIHPLWYSQHIPMLFFVSSIFAGLSIVIIESSLTHRIFAHRLPKGNHGGHDEIVLGLSKGAAGTMLAYFFLKIVEIVHGQNIHLLSTPMGQWYLLEVLGFVLFPAFLFLSAIKRRSVKMAQFAAVLTALGIMLNRLNISIIAFKWDSPNHYYPSWHEVVITGAIISIELWAFRWIVNRMPVLDERHDPQEVKMNNRRH